MDLEAKAEKYETKSARCREWARQAADGPQRNFYEELAGYYGHVAEDFRQVIAKQRDGRASAYLGKTWKPATPDSSSLRGANESREARAR
jgi:hypothetical protein